MPKIEANTDRSFLIDDVPYQKGVYELIPRPLDRTATEGTIKITRNGADETAVAEGVLSDWTDNTDSNFATIGDFLDYVEPFFFHNISGGGGGSYDVADNFGFIDYNDSSSSVSLLTDTWTDVPNDGAGPFSNSTYKPNPVTDVMDTSTGYLDFSDLTLGSEIYVRNDFSVNPTTNNALLEVSYVLGQGASEYRLLFWSERLDNGSGIDYQRVITFPIYMGDTNTQGGVGKLQVKLSTPGTLNNNGSYISIKLR